MLAREPQGKLTWLLALALLLVCVRVTAEETRVQAPVGGAPLGLPGGLVACSATGAWTVLDDGRVKPPGRQAKPGQAAKLTVAASKENCEGDQQLRTMTALTTGPVPKIAVASLYLDEGRLQLTGRRLKRVQIRYRGGKVSGADRCLAIQQVGGQQRCDLNVDSGLPASPGDVTLQWLPEGAVDGENLYDSRGRLIALGERGFDLQQIIITRLVDSQDVLDLADGRGEVELVHPEAVAAVECPGGRCELAGGKVIVTRFDRALERARAALSFRLRPRVQALRDGKPTDEPTVEVPVVFCPLEVVSGPPLRDIVGPRLVVRLAGRCGARAEDLRWRVGPDEADVMKVKRTKQHVYVLLQARRQLREKTTVSARLPGPMGTVFAVQHVPTRPAPQPSASLTLPGYGGVGFIPSNRPALLRIGVPRGGGQLVPVPVPGAYDVVRSKSGLTYIKALASSGGFVSLRFAYRVPEVQDIFPRADLAYLEEPIQRTIQQANVPVPLAVVGDETEEKPVVELVCTNQAGKAYTVPPGVERHIPFEQRGGCRLLVHQRNIPASAGQQRLHLEVTVKSVAGAVRPDGLNEDLVLRHQPHTRAFWIRGVRDEYDRAIVRVGHVVDESQYLSVSRDRLRIPAAQWELVFESSSYRFYATAAIPASLFRFSDDPDDLGTGPLALNFGVLSRLTWLNSDGREGLLGLELGVMGMGLANSNERQLNIVAGIGIGVPLGNINQPTQAALNVHAWVAYRLGSQTANRVDPGGMPGEEVQLSPWALIFGPSVTIGSVGINL